MSLEQRIGERERKYVLEVLQGQFRKSDSAASTRLEQVFADTIGVRFAIGFVNGTATMHSALAAMGVGPGDEVIVPPLTMASTSMAVVHCQASPVFADVDSETWNIDPRSVEACIGPRTKAILPVALYGLPPDMTSLMRIAERHGLQVLEDDAQCFLGSIHGKLVGGIAHASSFSFQSTKHMTCGEGGMVTTDDEGLAERIRRFSNLGYGTVGAKPGAGVISKEVIQNPAYLRHQQVGWNYRMSELCAAVALAQVERLEELVDRRIRVAELYRQALDGCGWLTPQTVPPGFKHAYWSYVLSLDNGDAFTWEAFRKKYLELGGDPMYGCWQVTYLEPAFLRRKFSSDQRQDYCQSLCPVAESVQPRLFQFKTNYFDEERAQRQAEALHGAIRFFDRQG